jgi:hypothetical protein
MIDGNDAGGGFFNSRPRAVRCYNGAMKTTPSNQPHPWEKQIARLVAFGLLAALLGAAFARAHAAETSAGAAAGIYQLASVDGQAVPCTVNHEGMAMRVNSGAFRITTNAECFCRMTVDVAGRTNIVCRTHATFTRAGDTLRWTGPARAGQWAWLRAARSP